MRRTTCARNTHLEGEEELDRDRERASSLPSLEQSTTSFDHNSFLRRLKMLLRGKLCPTFASASATPRANDGTGASRRSKIPHKEKFNAKHLRGKLLYNLCLISLGKGLGGMRLVRVILFVVRWQCCSGQRTIHSHLENERESRMEMADGEIKRARNSSWAVQCDYPKQSKTNSSPICYRLDPIHLKPRHDKICK